MTYENLVQNMIDMLAEQQLKLGYAAGTFRLYYPLQSLNRLLHVRLDEKEMLSALSDRSVSENERLGPVAIEANHGRFCFSFPSTAQDYIQTHMGEHAFLRELIQTLSREGTTMDDVLAVFFRHSDSVVVEPKTGEDFDVLAYFADGKPDAYRYCLTDEGCHIIYHRFTADDYHDFYPEG